MNKSGLLKALEDLRLRAESGLFSQDPEVQYLAAQEALDILLDYVNDAQIRKAVEAIPM